MQKLLFGGLAAGLMALALSFPTTADAARPAFVNKKSPSALKPGKPVKAGKALVSVRAKQRFAPRSVKRIVLRNGKRVVIRHPVARVRFEPARPSVGQMKGLHQTQDRLDLKSSVALVLDLDSDEVLFSKNAQAVLPIASLTKLMTAVVVAEAGLPPQEIITVTQEDVDTEKGSRSRLRVGTQLTREEMLHLALMSSENRAAHALGRSFPGGADAFVKAMNLKAIALGMDATRFVEPTGLSSQNRSSAIDLAALVKAAHQHPVIRELSTSPRFEVDLGSRHVQFVNTNRLLSNPDWDISLQKTGYISEAGRCLVMQTRLAGRELIMIFLDSAGKYSRLGDAERVRRWIEESLPAVPAPDAAELPRVTS